MISNIKFQIIYTLFCVKMYEKSNSKSKVYVKKLSSETGQAQVVSRNSRQGYSICKQQFEISRTGLGRRTMLLALSAYGYRMAIASNASVLVSRIVLAGCLALEHLAVLWNTVALALRN